MGRRKESAGRDGARAAVDRVRRQSPPAESIRVAIAQLAAKLIAEGLTDHHAAKLKAAKQLGMCDGRHLPDNFEIERELASHLALFESQTQPHALSLLREIALRLMQRLAEFSPSVTGAVLAGTANEFSEIELEIIGVEPKAFEMFLINAKVEFSLSERGGNRRGEAGNIALEYACEYNGVAVVISLYESQAVRQALHPANSIHHDRAGYIEAVKRFGAPGHT